MTISEEHPFTPTGARVQVRKEYQAAVSRRFGALYALSTLALRTHGDSGAYYAPVAIGPGGIAVFMWPAARLEEDWIEQV